MVVSAGAWVDGVGGKSHEETVEKRAAGNEKREQDEEDVGVAVTVEVGLSAVEEVVVELTAEAGGKDETTAACGDTSVDEDGTEGPGPGCCTVADLVGAVSEATVVVADDGLGVAGGALESCKPDIASSSSSSPLLASSACCTTGGKADVGGNAAVSLSLPGAAVTTFAERHGVSASRFSAAVAAAVVDCGGGVELLSAAEDWAAAATGVSMRLNAPFANDTCNSSSGAVELAGTEPVPLLSSPLRNDGGNGSNVGE